jgi:hypothetical protein
MIERKRALADDSEQIGDRDRGMAKRIRSCAEDEEVKNDF